MKSFTPCGTSLGRSVFLSTAFGRSLTRLQRTIASSPRWKDASKTQARMIRNPKEELKRIQRLIKSRIFGEDCFGPEVQGGISRRSPKSNAEKHAGARSASYSRR